MEHPRRGVPPNLAGLNKEEKEMDEPPPKSGFPYIYWHSPTRRWFARVRLEGEFVHVGFFDTVEEAKEALDSFLRAAGAADSVEDLVGQRKARRKMKSTEKFLSRSKRVEGIWEKGD